MAYMKVYAVFWQHTDMSEKEMFVFRTEKQALEFANSLGREYSATKPRETHTNIFLDAQHATKTAQGIVILEQENNTMEHLLRAMFEKINKRMN